MRILLTDARSLLSTRLIEFLNRQQGTAVRVVGREHPDGIARSRVPNR